MWAKDLFLFHSSFAKDHSTALLNAEKSQSAPNARPTVVVIIKLKDVRILLVNTQGVVPTTRRKMTNANRFFFLNTGGVVIFFFIWGFFFCSGWVEIENLKF